MKSLLSWVAALLLAVMATGCTGLSIGNSLEAITRQLIKLLDETADTLSTVTDEASAHAAADKLRSLSEDRRELLSKLNGLKSEGISPDESLRLEEKYGADMQASMQRVVQETMRLRRIPAAWGAIRVHMGPGTMPRGPMVSGMGGRAAQMRSKYGANRTLSLVVEGTGGDVSAVISKRVKEICKSSEMVYTSDANTLHLVCAPVDDIPGFASKVDFGTVVETDFDQGIVRVEADLSRLPKPLGVEVTDPNDPNFYKQNLEDMRSFDEFRASRAAERLAEAKPGEPRGEIVAAATRLVIEKKPGYRLAIGVVVRYTGKESIPLLAEVLRDRNLGSAHDDVADFLIEFGDAKSMELLAELVVNNSSLAHRMWRRQGAEGQQALYPYLKHEDPKIRREAVLVLRDIGSQDCVPAVIEVLNDQDARVLDLAIELLRELKDPRATSPLCRVLLTDSGRPKAIQALIAIGPTVEDTVIKGLKHSDPRVVKACCNVLIKVGTQKSLDALQVVMRDGNREMRKDAEVAAHVIEKRMSGR